MSESPLSQNCPESLNWPKIIKFWRKKQVVDTIEAVKSWRVLGKILFHECLVDVCGVGSCKVLLKNKVFVVLKKFAGVDSGVIVFFLPISIMRKKQALANCC